MNRNAVPSAASHAVRRRSRGLSSLVVVVGFLVITAGSAGAQISRHPTGVNVNAMGVTTVFLTFGNLNGKTPVEALWCGALVPASPDLGDRCDTATLFGRLPIRYDLARASGNAGLTDIMSIPASVARRAYQAAENGEASEFFYVRRFADPNGGPDEYVTVTCRMTDGGARVPFAITEARLEFATEDPVLAVRAGERLPPVVVNLVYNGTGRLTGRWEIVRPGEDPPRAEDLLPEASLPLELRARQRRFTEIERFDVFLPPAGEYTLAGPDPKKLPSTVEGEYRLLLRIEVSDDKEGDSDLGSAKAGTGLVHTGGVAGFSVPGLRYHVGAGTAVGVATSGFRTLVPAADAQIELGTAATFTWSPAGAALLFRVEFQNADGDVLLEAALPPEQMSYTGPPLLRERAGTAAFRWRVVALGAGGRVIDATAWRTAHFAGFEPVSAPGTSAR